MASATSSAVLPRAPVEISAVVRSRQRGDPLAVGEPFRDSVSQRVLATGRPRDRLLARESRVGEGSPEPVGDGADIGAFRKVCDDPDPPVLRGRVANGRAVLGERSDRRPALHAHGHVATVFSGLDHAEIRDAGRTRDCVGQRLRARPPSTER